MKSKKAKLASVLFPLIVSSCSIVPAKMYSDPIHERSKDAVISSLGLYPERKLSLTVVSINGKAVNTTRTAEFLLNPDIYKVTIRVLNDLHAGYPNVSWKEVTLEAEVNALAGHTYIPNAEISGESVSLKFDDMGMNYPQSCLPLYQFVSPSQGGARGNTQQLCTKAK